MKDGTPIVVVKVGGSLLDWPGLPARLIEFLDSMEGRRLVLIAGGGGMADVVRGWDRDLGLGEETSHSLSLRVLDVTARLLAALLGPRARVVEALDELPAAWSLPSRWSGLIPTSPPHPDPPPQGGRGLPSPPPLRGRVGWGVGPEDKEITTRSSAWPILAPRLVLDADDRDATGEALPHSWDVTTDSIAARVARLVGAADLFLLKSARIPEGISPADASTLGLVDLAFPQTARGLPGVSIVGFRH